MKTKSPEDGRADASYTAPYCRGYGGVVQLQAGNMTKGPAAKMISSPILDSAVFHCLLSGEHIIHFATGPFVICKLLYVKEAK